MKARIILVLFITLPQTPYRLAYSRCSVNISELAGVSSHLAYWNISGLVSLTNVYIFNSSFFLNNQINIFAKNYVYNFLAYLEVWGLIMNHDWTQDLIIGSLAHRIASGRSSSFTSPCLQLGALPTCFFRLGLVLETTVGFLWPMSLLFLSSCSDQPASLMNSNLNCSERWRPISWNCPVLPAPHLILTRIPQRTLYFRLVSINHTCGLRSVCMHVHTHTQTSEWGWEGKYLGLIQEFFGSSEIWGY